MSHYRVSVLLLALWIIPADFLQAQGLDGIGPGAGRAQRGEGYFFLAPGLITGGGSSTGTLNFGGGFEVFAYKGLAAGAEAGYLAPRQYLNDGIGLASVDGSYHFGRTSKISPFVTGGYSIGFRSGHANMVNFGGGLQYWFSRRTALRLEFRDHLYRNSYADVHSIGCRIGLSLR
jgi:hypothetical protein